MPGARISSDKRTVGENRFRKCAFCDRPFELARGPGRPRRFCTDECRVRAYRGDQSPGTPRRIGKGRFAKSDAIRGLRAWAAEHGSAPTEDEWAAAAVRPSARTIRRLFGSWPAALLAARVANLSDAPCRLCGRSFQRTPLGRHGRPRTICSPECRQAELYQANRRRLADLHDRAGDVDRARKIRRDAARLLARFIASRETSTQEPAA